MDARIDARIESYERSRANHPAGRARQSAGAERTVRLDTPSQDAQVVHLHREAS